MIKDLPLKTADQIQVVPNVGSLPPAAQSPNGYVFIVSDVGDLYWSDGSAWYNLSVGSGASAPAVTYTPSTPADWPVVPTDVQEGLDTLADVTDLLQTTINTGAPALAYTPVTPANWPIVPSTIQAALDSLITMAGLNVDGGTPNSIYGGLVNLDGGAP